MCFQLTFYFTVTSLHLYGEGTMQSGADMEKENSITVITMTTHYTTE